MEYIIIKLYTNEMQGDYHDINIDNLNLILQKMQDYAEKKGKKLYFASMTTDQTIGVPVNCSPFAEIEYTESITQEEKNKYVEYLKKISMNAEINGEFLEEFNTLKMFKFKKIEDEIVEIS